MLSAVERTARMTTQKIHAVRELVEDTQNYRRHCLPKIYSRELVEIIFAQPYCRIQNLVDAQIAKRQTASNYLKGLCQAGVLEEVQAGKEKLFIPPKLIALMTQDGESFSPYLTTRNSRNMAP